MAFPFLGAGVLDGGQQIGPGGPAGPGPARGGDDGCSRRGASPSRCQGALDRSRGLGRPRRESWALATWCAAPWQERGAGRAARSTPHRGWAAPAAVPGGSRLHSPPVPPIPLKLELRLAGDPVPCPARVEKEKKKSRRCRPLCLETKGLGARAPPGLAAVRSHPPTPEQRRGSR